MRRLGVFAVYTRLHTILYLFKTPAIHGGKTILPHG